MSKYREIEKEMNKDVDLNVIKESILPIIIIAIFIVFPIIPEAKNMGTYTLKTGYIWNIAFMLGTTVLIIDIFNKQIKFGIYEIILGAYSVLILLSTILSDYFPNTILAIYSRGEGALSLISYIIIFMIFYKIFKYSKSLFDYVTIAVLCAAIYGILQSLIGTELGIAYGANIIDAEYMAYGTMTNPNFFSSFMTLFLPIYIVKYLMTDEKEYIYVSIILFAGLICSKTLGGYITFGIYFAIISAFSLIIKKFSIEVWQKVAIITISFITVFALLDVSNELVYSKELISSRADMENISKGSKEFANNRGYIWNVAFNLIKEKPWFGVGPDQMGQVVAEKYINKPGYIFEDLVIDKAHCEYLHIAVTTGIPSLIVYVIFILTIGINLLKKIICIFKEKNHCSESSIFVFAVSISLLAYLIQSGANISVTCVAPVFWAMLGIGANIANKNNKVRQD